MSRETDSSSTGPQRRGSGGYPPGADPYGVPLGPDDSEPASGPGSAAHPADEPLTETTLTTRVRINIPGSRPIPPVVMRTPVSGVPEPSGEPASGRGPVDSSDGGSGATASAGPPGGGESGASERRTSDWFAPRKAPTGNRPSGNPPPAPGTPGAGAPLGGTLPPHPPRSRPSGGLDPSVSPFAEPDERAPGASPGHTPAFGTASGPGGSPFDEPNHPTPGASPTPAFGTGPGLGGFAADSPYGGPLDAGRTATPPAGVPSVGGLGVTGGSGGPDGPDGGGMSVLPPGFARPDTPGAPGTRGPGPGTDGVLGPNLAAPGSGPRSGAGHGPQAPFGGGPSTVEGADRGSPFGPAGGVHPPGPADRVSGDTLNSGLPVIQPDPLRPTSPPPGPPVPQPPESAADEPAPAPARPARKGRSKLVLVGATLIAIVGLAYGAGLLLDHAQVPNGTTVLGVEVGGTSKQEAIDKLESQLGDRVADPLNLRVGEEEIALKPSVAGLSLDIETTVRNAAGRDYNPMTVIGSLMGGAREAEPEITVDEEKLHAALEELATGGSSAQEGTVAFKNGEATPVYGKPYESLDVTKAAAAVEQSYRDRAATGEDGAIVLPVSEQQPRVGKAEVDRALKEFGQPAMSGWVWVQAGGVEVPFSEDTLSELITMKPSGSGTLQPVIDLEKLEAAYGSAFDEVKIDAGAGQVPLTPKHVATTMVEALRTAAPAQPEKRIALVEGAVTS